MHLFVLILCNDSQYDSKSWAQNPSTRCTLPDDSSSVMLASNSSTNDRSCHTKRPINSHQITDWFNQHLLAYVSASNKEMC